MSQPGTWSRTSILFPGPLKSLMVSRAEEYGVFNQDTIIKLLQHFIQSQV